MKLSTNKNQEKTLKVFKVNRLSTGEISKSLKL